MATQSKPCESCGEPGKYPLCERCIPTHVSSAPEVTTDNYFDAAQGLHWYCSNYHDGQWSTLYRVLSTLGYKPAPSENDCTTDESIEFYNALVAGELDAETLHADILSAQNRASY